MKIKELIAKLQEFDGELYVNFSEGVGNYDVTRVTKIEADDLCVAEPFIVLE
jgi:hypothetical protein